MGFPAKGVLKSCPQKEEGRPELTCKPNKQETCSLLRLLSHERPLAVRSPAELRCAQSSDIVKCNISLYVEIPNYGSQTSSISITSGVFKNKRALGTYTTPIKPESLESGNQEYASIHIKE